jgi:pimeloyl-ACP methyl ester carboxylesterase
MKTLVACALVAGLAAAASADPTLDMVTSAVGKGGSVVVTVETTLTTAGVVTVGGELNGLPVTLKKKTKGGHKTLKFVVDPKKLRLKKLTQGLHYDLDVTAVETASGLEASQHVTKTVPLPCVVLPGLANEQTPGGFAAFAAALDLAAGGVYGVGAAKPSIVVHEYASLSTSLFLLGKGLDKTIKTALKGTPFVKVDVVGYSYGGVVARSYLSQFGGAKVRDCVFMGSPNLGTPIAYVGVGLLNNGQLATLLGANPELAGAVGTLLNDQTKGALKNLYPTYTWLQGSPILVAVTLGLLGQTDTPLTALNQKAPPVGVNFHAFYYSSTGTTLGTVDVVDVSNVSLDASELDPSKLATGAGDGVVPAHSVTMDEVAAWSAVIAKHDLGAGTHVTMPVDILGAVPGVAAVLTAE